MAFSYSITKAALDHLTHCAAIGIIFNTKLGQRGWDVILSSNKTASFCINPKEALQYYSHEIRSSLIISCLYQRSAP